MYANKVKIIVSLSLVGVLMMGCVSTPGPEGWLPTPKEALPDAFGAWMIVESVSEADKKISEGEFIAVQNKKVYLLTKNNLIVISTDKVRHVTLATYREKRIVGVWTFLGTLSTISHGFYSLISVPIWLSSGIWNAAAESSSGILKISALNWQEIQKYARFPQGIPQGIDLQLLKGKPLAKKKPG